VDEHSLAGPRTSQLKQGAVRSGIRNISSRALGVAHTFWQEVHLGPLAQRQLRIGAGDCPGGIDTLPKCQV